MPARKLKSNCFGPMEDIENTILCTGSHDLAIGVLEDQLKLSHPELKIAATNVGSLGGLLASQRGETHIAGTHLLDTESGVYNIPDIKKTIPKVPLVLVHLAQREQGILVARGNPKSITGLKDLARRSSLRQSPDRAPARVCCSITS